MAFYVFGLRVSLEQTIHQAVQWLLDAASIPQAGLSAVFIVALVSATLLPMGSEPVLFAYVKLSPHMFWIAVLVATTGNSIGGMINYWIGYGAHEAIAKDKHAPRALKWFEKLGPKACFFSFLPGIGDPLTAVAGYLKLPWLPCLLWQTAGKFTRYVVMTAALLWIPNSFWKTILGPFASWFFGS
ncbi:MAG: inner membrane protein yqaA [Pseudomonadota bacterium]|jgi:membrane protein YqaA with SNARE-associated domain